jgi:hypothetical protein
MAAFLKQVLVWHMGAMGVTAATSAPDKVAETPLKFFWAGAVQDDG